MRKTESSIEKTLIHCNSNCNHINHGCLKKNKKGARTFLLFANKELMRKSGSKVSLRTLRQVDNGRKYPVLPLEPWGMPLLPIRPLCGHACGGNRDPIRRGKSGGVFDPKRAGL